MPGVKELARAPVPSLTAVFLDLELGVAHLLSGTKYLPVPSACQCWDPSSVKHKRLLLWLFVLLPRQTLPIIHSAKRLGALEAGG